MILIALSIISGLLGIGVIFLSYIAEILKKVLSIVEKEGSNK